VSKEITTSQQSRPKEAPEVVATKKENERSASSELSRKEQTQLERSQAFVSNNWLPRVFPQKTGLHAEEGSYLNRGSSLAPSS
jgi:hypothetical protein